jgi:hypothetical protein
VGGGGAALAAGHAVRASGPSAVPWRQVGPGWVLAENWPGRLFSGQPKSAPATLYLFSPVGRRYRLYRWPATKNPPFLLDWSADKTRALTASPTGTGQPLEQVTLATGKVTRFRLAGKADVLGYTRPAGQGLLGIRPAGKSGTQLARYTLTGRLAKVLSTGPDEFSAVYSPSGATLAVGGAGGVHLVSNDGGVLRRLPVPGVTRCNASRWWNSATILASCTARGTSRARLWLVPAGGGTPTALTAQRSRTSPDPGDLDGWRLRGGLYLQALTAAGLGRIFRQAQNGSVTRVTVPGRASANWILGTHGPRLLVYPQNPCSFTSSLLWFNPATRKEQVLIKTQHGQAGATGAVPFGQPVAPVFIVIGCGAGGSTVRTEH